MPLALRAIPIQKDLKRYYWSKFCWLKYHNGPKHACDVFKTLRQVLMSYIDTHERHLYLEEFISRCPVRKNGWLLRLFTYADTQPHAVLQFLKLYTCVEEPVVTVEEAAEDMQALLESARPCGTPAVLSWWLWCFGNKAQAKQVLYNAYYGMGVRDPHFQDLYDLFTGIAEEAKSEGQSVKDCIRNMMDHFDRTLRILTPKGCTDEQAVHRIQQRLPTLYSYFPWKKMEKKLPSEYTDIGDIAGGDITPLDEDLMALCSFVYDEKYAEYITPILDTLPEELLAVTEAVNPGEEDTSFVGHIRHIPKKGTVVRRAIADPNKFLQAGLEPYRKFLRSMTNKIPRNCQFDQAKLDHVIVARLNHGYAGSVDLSQATDWLPLSWFREIEKCLHEVWYPSTPTDNGRRYENDYLVRSRNLFYRMSRGCWENEGYSARWLRGQPLGTTPSFEVLTLTHFCLLEALCWAHGRYDSPYALLGDDVVIFDARVRECYICYMQWAGSPLSLHKSFNGRLTEFAGKAFIINQKVRSCTDIPMIGWSNLFDWQRSTGVKISYGDLPKEVKDRVCRHASDYQSSLRPEDLYEAMRWCAMLGTDFQADTQVTGNPVIGELVSNFIFSESTSQDVEVYGTFGFVSFDGGVGTYDHVVHLPTKLRKQRWWTKKVRPVSTTSIVNRCLGRGNNARTRL